MSQGQAHGARTRYEQCPGSPGREVGAFSASALERPLYNCTFRVTGVRDSVPIRYMWSSRRKMSQAQKKEDNGAMNVAIWMKET